MHEMKLFVTFIALSLGLHFNSALQKIVDSSKIGHLHIEMTY